MAVSILIEASQPHWRLRKMSHKHFHISFYRHFAVLSIKTHIGAEADAIKADALYLLEGGRI